MSLNAIADACAVLLSELDESRPHAKADNEAIVAAIDALIRAHVQRVITEAATIVGRVQMNAEELGRLAREVEK